MENKKTPQLVKKFLLKTGFPFEMSVAKTLRDSGYEVKINPFFLDLEEDKMREIDIVAIKKIKDTNIVFVIECKQSGRDGWIFVAPENNPSRFWRYVKHRPEIDKIEDIKKCFPNLHFFDRKINLANNYITFDGDKKSDPSSLNDAVSKSIKGTLANMADFGFDYGSEEKALFFSVVFFSGDIFLATYNKTLSVKKEKHLLLKSNFTSSAYNDISAGRSYTGHFYVATTGENVSWEERRKREKVRLVKKLYTLLKPEFIIDIVKDTYIKKYIKLVEDEVSNIPVEFWKEKSDKNEDD